jgi:hypothetical protein
MLGSRAKIENSVIQASLHCSEGNFNSVAFYFRHLLHLWQIFLSFNIYLSFLKVIIIFF